MSRKSNFVLVSVVLMAGSGCSDAPPYTSHELLRADIKCDAELLGAEMDGSQRPGYDKWSEGHTFYECMEDELPDLTDEQLADFSKTMSDVEEYEEDGEVND